MGLRTSCYLVTTVSLMCGLIFYTTASTKMTRPFIEYDDRSGHLVSNEVWLLDTVTFDSTKQGSLVYALCSYTGKNELVELHECALDRRHVTGYRFERLFLDLYGETLADFIIVADDVAYVVSDSFSRRLEKSRLTGYRVCATVRVNKYEPAIASKNKSLGAPRLAYLEITGKREGPETASRLEGRQTSVRIVGKFPWFVPHAAKLIG